MKTSEYWSDRALKYGHTGWSDITTYAFDQKFRLHVLKKAVKENVFFKNKALDFGCGVGDFAFLLSSDFEKIIAMDISKNILNVAAEVNYSPNIEYALSSSMFDLDNDSFDLIYTVTVLQHVLDTSELSRILQKFNSLLSFDGKLIIYESFSNKTLNSSYQKIRNLNEWTVLIENHFLIEKVSISKKSFEEFEQDFNRFRLNFLIRGLSWLSRKINNGKWNLIFIKFFKIFLGDFEKLSPGKISQELDNGMVLFVVRKRLS